MKRLLVLVVLAFGLSASKCSPNPPTPVVDAAPAPIPVADAAPVVPSCASACARAAALGCNYAAPSPLGITCEAVCQNAQQFVPWDFACRTNIKTCADVLNCH